MATTMSFSRDWFITGELLIFIGEDVPLEKYVGTNGERLGVSS